MACCTTIPHLNNKRKSGGIFDLPRASKQRRPLASTMTTAATSSFLVNRPSTMFTTSASAQDKHVFVEAESSVRSSVFQMKTSYLPLADVTSSLDTEASSSPNDDCESQFRADLMARIRHEAKRLIKRKQITLSTSPTTTTSVSASFSLVEPVQATSPVATAAATSNKLSSNSVNDLPIFSMNQVNAICERMIGERETAIREEYDKILAQKMSEQYDAFVKFTHEQIQRRFASSQCSYVS